VTDSALSRSESYHCGTLLERVEVGMMHPEVMCTATGAVCQVCGHYFRVPRHQAPPLTAQDRAAMESLRGYLRDQIRDAGGEDGAW
jgi:hypothetical protein